MNELITPDVAGLKSVNVETGQCVWRSRTGQVQILNLTPDVAQKLYSWSTIEDALKGQESLRCEVPELTIEQQEMILGKV